MAAPIQPRFNTAIPTPRPDSPRQAAQRAFFQAAMNGTAPVQTVAEPAQAPRPAPVQRVMSETPQEAPTRILRPGSLLDIRV